MPYILKARIATPTIPQKKLNFPQISPKMPQNGPKMTQNDPKWPKYYPKWPKMALEWLKMIQSGPKMTQNDAKRRPDLRTFSVIFFDWKGGPANFFAFRMYARCILAMFLVTISNKLKIAANLLKFAPNLKASGKCMGVLMMPKLKSKSHNLSKKAHLSGSRACYNNVHV